MGLQPLNVIKVHSFYSFSNHEMNFISVNGGNDKEVVFIFSSFGYALILALESLMQKETFFPNFINFFFLVILLSLFPQSLSHYNITDIVIMPTSQTSRGAIGAGRVCPVNEYAIGYRLKMQNKVLKYFKNQLVSIQSSIFLLGWKCSAWRMERTFVSATIKKQKHFRFCKDLDFLYETRFLQFFANIFT